jgi:hypothetical protein
MTDFEEDKQDMMKESLEDLLEQVFSGSYLRGSTEAAIRAKIRELRQQASTRNTKLNSDTSKKEKGVKKGLVVVAHPDDEFLFAHNLVKQELDIDWTILCITHAPDSDRGQKFSSSCMLIGATPEYLCLEDISGKHLDFSLIEYPGITRFFKTFDMVYTHNKLGEYGNIHHQDCYRWVTVNYSGELWVFAYNYKISEVTYQDDTKPVSSILSSVYHEEAEFLKTFNLVIEGFVRVERRIPCARQ